MSTAPSCAPTCCSNASGPGSGATRWRRCGAALTHLGDRAAAEGGTGPDRRRCAPIFAGERRGVDEVRKPRRPRAARWCWPRPRMTRLVTRLAADHGLSERVFASDGATNLKGARKAEALVAAFGEGGFDYAGNEPADRKVWAHADTRAGGGRRRLGRGAGGARASRSTRIAGGWSLAGLLKALRPHQWVKNVLLFLPLMAAPRVHCLALARRPARHARVFARRLVDLRGERSARPRGRPAARHQVPPPLCLRRGADRASAWPAGLVAGAAGAADRGADRLGVSSASWRSTWCCRWPIRCGSNGCAGSTSPRSPRSIPSAWWPGRWPSGVGDLGLPAGVHLPGVHRAGRGQAADRADAGHYRRAAAGPRLRQARPGRSVERRGARHGRRAGRLLRLFASPNRRRSSTRHAGCSGWRWCRSAGGCSG